jgi:hypothetical protein
MKRLVISAIAAVAVLATTITLLWSHTPLQEHLYTAALQEHIYTAANANKLPNQEIEDQSLIFPGVAKP